jgi:hypothetical protein
MSEVRSSRLFLLLMTLLLLLSLTGPLSAAAEEHEAHTIPFAKKAFAERYNYLDHPQGRTTDRPAWRWGPGPLTPGMVEPYLDAPGGFREVQYFDKGRMEINDLTANRGNLWYATGGLLVDEMIEGWFQIGENEIDASPDPAGIAIAGDQGVEGAVTYADLESLGLLEPDPQESGEIIVRAVVDGEVTSDQRFADYGVDVGVDWEGMYYSVASLFINFMLDTGEATLDTDGDSVTVTPNILYLTGFPITEPFWTTTLVDGTERDVLIQCFERRCLTYTPENPEGWQVESNNAGEHYVVWRYGEDGPETETISLFLTAIGDAGERGEEFGCDDSLVPVEVEILASDDPSLRIAAALQALFVYQPDETDDLYNVFDPMSADLGVVAVTIFEDTAAVTLAGDLLIGGVCDEPRVVEQIRHTVLQFDGIEHMVTLYRDGALFPSQQTPDDGIVATFRVGVETFRVWVTNEETIEQIFALDAGESMAAIPNGTLHYGPGEFDHNLPWGWHLDPEEIEMAEMTIELCDGNPAFVEAELDYFVETVGNYCTWAAELVSIEDFRD